MPIFNSVLVLDCAGCGQSFRPVRLDELPEEVLEELEPLLSELPEGCVTLSGNRYRWRPE